MPRRFKKSFTEKLSNKLDRLGGKPTREKGYNRAYQEVYRDHYGNLLLPRVGFSGGSGPEPWSPHAPSPSPRRTFHNVIPRGRSSSSHNGANLTWSGWDGGGGFAPVPKTSVAPEPVLYSDVVYGDYQKFAINSNVCMCEDYLGGTQRGRKGTKRCKKCGFDRPGSETYRGMRRSLSEESVSAATGDPYEFLRKRRLVYPKPVFYDEQDEYEDIMFDQRPDTSDLNANKTRNSPPKSGNKNFTRTQSMNLNNRNRLNTKDSKDMHNIAIRSSPLRTPVPTPNPSNKNVVTVNGCAGRNSSIIYLSPDSAPTQPLHSDTTSIKITTSTPVKSSAHASPYELIKKYVEDTPPNSLSDSNLSSDGQPDKVYSKSESEFSDSSSEPGRDAVGRYNSFKISGQKIQIYSDCSVRQSEELSSSSDSEADSEYSNYDADCSVVESPRVLPREPREPRDPAPWEPAPPPVKPPRRRSAEKEMDKLQSKAERVEVLDLEEPDSFKPSPRGGQEMRTLPRPNSGSRQTLSCNPKVMISRKISSDSQRSLTSRSKSFSGSRDSLFGSVDFKHYGISKNFSSEIIQELYGSKTSLLKTIEYQNERRRQANPDKPLFDTEEEEEEEERSGSTTPGSVNRTGTRVCIPVPDCVQGPDSGHYDVPTDLTSPGIEDPADKEDYISQEWLRTGRTEQRHGSELRHASELRHGSELRQGPEPERKISRQKLVSELEIRDGAEFRLQPQPGIP